MPNNGLSNLDKVLILAAGADTERAVKKLHETVEKGLGELTAAQREQTQIANDQAQRQRVDSLSLREAPQRLWSALNERDSVFAACDTIVAKFDAITPEEASATAENLLQYRPFFHDVLGINSMYLADFEQKNQLANLRSGCVVQAMQINDSLPVLATAIARKTLTDRCSPFTHLTPQQAKAFLADFSRWRALGTDLTRKGDSRSSKSVCLAVLGGVSAVIAYPLSLYLFTCEGAFDNPANAGFYHTTCVMLFLVPGVVLLLASVKTNLMSQQSYQERDEAATSMKSKWEPILPPEQWETAVQWLGTMKWVDGGWEIPSEVLERNVSMYTKNLAFPVR